MEWLDFSKGVFESLAVVAAVISVIVGTAATVLTAWKGKRGPSGASGEITPEQVHELEGSTATSSRPFEVLALSNY